METRWVSLPRALLLIFAVRALFAAFIPLSNDEAYYWTWSQNLALSYYDHPAMVALFIKSGTLIFGETPFGIRIAGIAASTLISYIYYGFTGSKWGALALQATLIFGVALNFITPDSPLLFFWCLALFFITYNYWIPAGLFIGLAFSAKYSAALLGLGLVLLIIKDNREAFKTPSLYIGGVVALLAASPVFIWNMQNGYVSFIKQGGRAFVSNFNPISFIEMSFGFMALLTPIIAFLFIKGLKGKLHHPLIITSLPLVVFFIYKSLFDKVELNWVFPLVFAAIFIADKAEGKMKQWALPTGFALSLITLIIIVTKPFNLSPNLTDQLYGWEKAAKEITALTGDKPIYTLHYTTNAQIRFHLKRGEQLTDRERYLHEKPLTPPKTGDYLVTEKRHIIALPFQLEEKAEIKMNNFSLVVLRVK